jgi:hypothetical protein
LASAQCLKDGVSAEARRRLLVANANRSLHDARAKPCHSVRTL